MNINTIMTIFPKDLSSEDKNQLAKKVQIAEANE